MAVVPFNCNKIKRTFWPFTMKDKTDGDKVVEKGKNLVVRMPQKGVFEAIKALDNMDEENQSIEDTDAIYDLLAAVLNNNMNGIKITVEDVKDYDIEECTAILNAYMEFVDELKTDPN
ncbi:MAG: hypothetical protein J1E01_01185 [Acetatifactor sp.]|nr:hypothetical protein [Acetatifactor sp.]